MPEGMVTAYEYNICNSHMVFVHAPLPGTNKGRVGGCGPFGIA